MTNQRKEVNSMLKELKQRIIKVECLACNGNSSLNSYDSYSCPICRGTGFVEVQALEEVLLPETKSNAEIRIPEEVLLPLARSMAGGYEFNVEHL
jgi:DnaJ-class molecular chaperone